MRSSAALLVGALLVVSAVAAVGVGAGAETGHAGESAVHSSSTLGESPADRSESPAGSLDAPTNPRYASTAPPDPQTADSEPPKAVSGSVNATAHDATEMYVAVRENGNARWNVTARFVLEDENETEAFNQLAQDYENGDPNVGFTRATFARILERAATETDRSMVLQDVSRSSSLRENETIGTLSLSFTWTNFTRVQGSRIVLGDVFWTGSETWLPSLSDDQSLTIEGPTGYYVASANVPHNSTRIEFEGPRTFESGDFAVSYAPKTTETTTTETTTTTTEGFPDISSRSGLLVALVVFGVGFGAYAVSQRRGPDPNVAEADDGDERGPAASSGVAAEQARTDEERQPGGDGESESGTDEEAEGPPTELLSDEERVLRLLRERDGRMKQADIVTETKWSNAKVSQLLSKMNENGEVNKLRIGRENLITLPDEDVTDFD